MFENESSGECYPITWVGRVPVYLATIFTAVAAASMILTSVLMAVFGSRLPSNAVLAPLIFFFPSVQEHWTLWQFVSYAFVNPPSLGFAMGVVLFAWFGTDVEKFFGRKGFAGLCATLLLASPVCLSILSLFGVSWPYFGATPLLFTIFIAFAIIYPRAAVLFGIEVRWIALALVAVLSLQDLAYHQWPELVLRWWNIGVVTLWLKWAGLASLATPSVSELLRRKHSARHLKVVPQKKAAKPAEVGVHDSIDPILEKIARQGIGSLSRGEREKLERARAALLEKERGR
jgi:hypothetical protein